MFIIINKNSSRRLSADPSQRDATHPKTKPTFMFKPNNDTAIAITTLDAIASVIESFCTFKSLITAEDRFKDN